jgi:hypothetical protein
VDGRTHGVPPFGQQYWKDFAELIAYRNGLVHASASRPDAESIPEQGKRPGSHQHLIEQVFIIGIWNGVAADITLPRTQNATPSFNRPRPFFRN